MTDPTRDSRDDVTTPVGVKTLCPQCGASVPVFETRCGACGAQISIAAGDEQREQLRQRLQNGIGDAYELLELLGKGGMGVVFRAREKALEREVALKVLAFDPLMVPEAFARFEREAKLAARLDHPHIVPIFAVGQGQGIAYYTMRLVRGGSLEDLLKKQQRIDAPRALRILREIALALDYAHSHGVVHRDVKPANVMLGDNDHVMVADFGIARAIGGNSGPALTSTGVVGSPAYMAPEQWQGLEIDGRADQYALGILAYELLTGKRPYRDASIHELLRMHLTEELPDISQELPTATSAMRSALRRATAKEPGARFATAAEFVKAIELSSGTPVAPMRAVPAPRAAAGARAPAVAKRPEQKQSRLLPIGLLLLLVAAFGGYEYVRRSGAPAQPAQVPSPESVVVHETVTVVKTAKPDTVRLVAPGKPDTVRIATPVISPPANRGVIGSGDAKGYILVQHPLLQRGEVHVDNTTTYVNAMPAIIAVDPGPHLVRFSGQGPTVPPRYTPVVRAGDTVRVMFVPAQGGGARGDTLREQLARRLRMGQQQQRGGRGRGGRGGGGGE